MDRDNRSLGSQSRRRFLRCAAVLAGLPSLPAAATDETVRIGLTPVFLDDQMSFLRDWRRWLEVKLGRTVAFVQRGSYREVVDLIRAGKLDFGWVCGYPYVRYQRELKLVAVPLWQGGPYYRSYIIVPADDTRTGSIADLHSRVFAYSDPDSNSGYLYPRYLLATHKEDPSNFFSRTFFTWAHRKVVEAVGVALADGGAVDGYVWETLAELRPELTRATRIVERSPLLGHPPIVARADIPPAELERFRAVLLGMAADPVGEELLRRLHLDGFTRGNPELFADIARMATRMEPP